MKMKQDATIRDARADDAAAIADIYNDAVLNTDATLDTEAFSVEDRRQWLHERGASFPVIVAELDGVVVGWASLKPYSVRPGTRFTAVESVYVRKDRRGRGIGGALLQEILRRAERSGMHTVLARIIGTNKGSIDMHEKYGFQHVGVMREVGFKFDRWLDNVVMQYMCKGDSDSTATGA